jgi:hypothetical protein
MDVQIGNDGRVGARETNPSAQTMALAMSPSKVCTHGVRSNTDRRTRKLVQ